MLKKRPLFTGALFLALLIWFLSAVCGVSFGLGSDCAGKEGVLSGELLREEEKETRIYWYLRRATFTFGSAGEASFSRPVLLVTDKDTAHNGTFCIGNRLSAKVLCCGFSVPRNEGNFDEARYYHSLGIAEKFELEGRLQITDHRIRPLRQLFSAVRKRIRTSIREVTDAKTAGVLEAVLTGGRDGLDRETKELFQKSGIAHILAISGLHISMFGSALFSLLRRRLPQIPSAVLAGAFLTCYCILSGESPSAVRATVMFLLRLVALCCGKTFDLLNGLGAAALFLLLQNPMYLFHSGFQLSFGAILGIGLVAPTLSRLFPGHSKDGRKAQGKVRKVLEKGREAFLVSLSVTLLTLPMVIQSYYQVPLFSVALNLLVVPLMSFVLEGGMAGAAAGLISLVFGRTMIGLSACLVQFLEWICAALEQIPFSVVVTGHLSPLRVALYYLVLGLFLLAGCLVKADLSRRLRRYVLSGLTLALLCLIVFVSPARRDLSITFFDVDQGDGMVFQSPSGKTYMIDGGSSSVTDLYHRRLESALKYKGISVLDYVVLTHPDTDHISGILGMLEESGAGRIRIRHLLLPEVSDNENEQAILQKARSAGVSVAAMHTGMRLTDGALSFSCLHPDPDFQSVDVNDYSVVLQLEYGSFRALFTGDLPETEEHLLLQKQKITPCQFLKVAHHGSRFSTTPEFLSALRPEAAVISAGISNRYGHPHPEVLERLRFVGAKTWVTAQNGAITLVASQDGTFHIRPLYA